MIGKELSEVFTEIESTLLAFELNPEQPPHYTEEGFRASIRIFMSTLMDKMWQLQEAEGMEMQQRSEMALKAGSALRDLIKTYTNKDTFDMY